MNYHLMVDDKFIDGFIADAEQVSSGKNIYIIEGNLQNAKYVKHPLVTFVDSLENFLDELKLKLSSGDKVLIHWLHYRLEQFILGLPVEIKVGLLFWGGDIVQEPKTAYKNLNYEPLTLSYFEKFEEKKPRNIPFKANPFNILRNIRKEYKYRIQLKIVLESKHKVLSRLNYFLHWNQLDYDWIQKRVKDFAPEFIYHYYGIGLETDLPLSDNGYKQKTIFWLGNSAALSNNHLDALNLMRRFKEDDIEIVCPMSYGDYDSKKYTRSVIDYGQEIFGDQFRAITEFLTRTEYYKLLRDADVVIMYHNRTQAAGNSAAFMLMGKKIFMQEESTFYQLLKQHKAHVFLNRELTKMSMAEIKSPLTDQQMRHNQAVVKKILDYQKKMQSLLALLN